MSRQVCDGCWKRGYCAAPGTCRCPCKAEGWTHADDPFRPHRVGTWARLWRWLW